jgi:hypothetical protein
VSNVLRITITALLLATSLAAAQIPLRDPLTEAEADQLRELAQEPEKRLKLLCKFAQSRMLAAEQLRGDPKLAQGRGEQLHGLIEDVMLLVKELDRNVDMFAEQRMDIRKPMKAVIEAETAIHLKLRALKETSQADAAAQQEARAYQFVLEDAIETVETALDNARSVLENQQHEVQAAKDREKSAKTEKKK